MRVQSRAVQRVLGYVNRIRGDQGKRALKRLPKGKPSDPRCCVIAKAIEGNQRYCSTSYYDRSGFRRTIPAPQYVRDFVLAFDNGRIPELIDR